MKLEIGMEITAETIFKEVVTGKIISILKKSVVIENETGRHVIKREMLKKMGHSVGTPSRPDRKRVQLHLRKNGE